MSEAKAVLATTVSMLMTVGVLTAHAGWKPEYVNSPYREWYAQQHDQEGWWCCDYSDAYTTYDAYLKDGKWYVPIDGIDHEISPEQLLDSPNPTGHGVVWYDQAGDHVTIFCFAPGTLF